MEESNDIRSFKEIKKHPLNSMIAVASYYPMTESQRVCLEHVLRNVLTGISYSLQLIENRDRSLSANELALCLYESPKLLSTLIKNLKRGSFCPLELEQCGFVSKHTGCNPKEDYK